MRSKHVTDPQGLVVRKFHAIPIVHDKQTTFEWKATPDLKYMEAKTSMLYTRNLIRGMCISADNTRRSYNENFNVDNPQIEMSYDFTPDLLEARTSPTHPDVDGVEPREGEDDEI